MPKDMEKIADMLRAAAQPRQVEGELEVDEAAVISAADDMLAEGGAYVQAWLWVPLTPEMRKALGEEQDG